MTLEPTYLLFIALCSILLLLLLIMKFRLHAFLALTLVSFITAVVTGVNADQVVPTMMSGFGGTLASVALLVGLGTMIGRILEVTGGAKVLADTLIGRFGSERAPFALGVASLLFGFPIFFDAGLMVMMPILFSVAKQFGGSTIKYALPVAGAFAVMHAFLPPHPGPVAAGELLGANIGLLTIVGLVIALPTWYLGAYLYGLWAGERFKLPLPQAFLATQEVIDENNLPKFSTVLAILLMPLVLIFMDTGLHTLTVMGVVDGQDTWVNVLRMLGKTPIALMITLLFCLALFSKNYGMAKLEKLCGDSLAPICAVILVTGAGGMFGGVLRASGIGDALANLMSDMGMPVIVAAFLVSTALRVAQGSATVALTTTAALIAPMVAATTGLSALDLCFIVIAIASGATVLSHFNDSGFWLVGKLLDMDEKTTLKTWTVMETLLGTIAFIIAATLSVFL
ncbi:GntP family permease [Photobacterium leiognathi]|uniref:GntP family permease n=2 Tax=Photobacterium leiognathi TaxID=553611 RepID=A0A0D8M682_PHOLE|nr:GntP family permease [Photobacterium leiognathi]KJF89699.1 permease [Photobacterium leiognathi]KJF94746.1 permease [Photobacterium leiognathi]MCG3883740.1 GntP family permease [Photobacterium leiognathi]PHZ58275.1 permease [Photobacterium leiognathi]PSV02516.1 GntP family permease [Photobacterium leiognathi subsp. mandapamensis]